MYTPNQWVPLAKYQSFTEETVIFGYTNYMEVLKKRNLFMNSSFGVVTRQGFGIKVQNVPPPRS
jgi:hypothetical protein